MDTISQFTGAYRFLSNFYESPIREALPDGTTIVYPTVEHAFQAAKSLDTEVRIQIANEKTPSEAKKAGGRHGYMILRPDWEEVKLPIMLSLLRCKFMNNPELRYKLLSTGDATLIEGNTWNDTFWGVCKGKGQNMLGRLLMQVRRECEGIHRTYSGIYR